VTPNVGVMGVGMIGQDLIADPRVDAAVVTSRGPSTKSTSWRPSRLASRCSV
jgi:hypothetical protein